MTTCQETLLVTVPWIESRRLVAELSSARAKSLWEKVVPVAVMLTMGKLLVRSTALIATSVVVPDSVCVPR